MSNTICRVGCATGFSGDRADGAIPLVQTLIAKGGGVLVFETLAERTLALAQLELDRNPEAGYESQLHDLISPILADCLRHHIPIVGNFGAANPRAAAMCILEIARQQGLPEPRVAVVFGDKLETPEQRQALRERLGAALDEVDVVSANAYIGAHEIAEALSEGAQVVVTGRVADPSLVLGPALAQHGWRADDWAQLGCATIAGHLLECGAQVTGGYFAVPGLKDVPDLHAVGMPIVEILQDGSFTVSKAGNTGGYVNARTVKEQLLYEVHDPARYLTPDVVADFSQAYVEEVGQDEVAVHGVTGHARPDELKVNVCYRGGWLAEAEISYAGLQAEARARLAAEIVRCRIADLLPLRIDLIGALSILGDDAGRMLAREPDLQRRDVRLRVAAIHEEKSVAQRVPKEVTALYTCGPAGGGGVRTSLQPRLHMMSCTIPRALVRTGWYWMRGRE
ncbi:acyclic terpene utilization AtuA family protein [Paracandidimonas soli]|uniref:acyclic terpene utilization AtuA family protein n=1 Tax=Paracandidimonas soli TaxID=1917182 RepID=UPI00334021FA